MAEQNGALKIALGSGDGAAGVLSQLNPEGVNLIITNLVVDVTTKSTGAGTADFGVATTAVTNDTLIDGLDVGSAAILADNVTNKGTNGKKSIKWAAGSYLTGSKATGNMAGLVGSAYVEYVRA